MKTFPVSHFLHGDAPHPIDPFTSEVGPSFDGEWWSYGRVRIMPRFAANAF